MAARFRYLSDDDPVDGVTRSQFRKLGRTRQLAYMRHWFETYYEDPAHETPREDKEFIYIWGGPYDARDALGDEFGDLVSDERMQEAVELVQRDGIFDWAPTDLHPSKRDARDEDAQDDDSDARDPETIDDLLSRLERGLPMAFGRPLELAQRAVVRHQVDTLRAALVQLSLPTPGMGHNNPPPDDDGVPSVSEIEMSVAEIGSELDKPEPDPVTVVAAASRISRIGKWLNARFEKVGERAVEDLIRGALVVAGGAAVTVATRNDLPGLMHNVVTSVMNWVHVLGSPF